MLRVLFCLLCSFSTIVYAEGERNYTLNGFATLGTAFNGSDDSISFVRDLSQPSGTTESPSLRVDSNLGLQLNLLPDSDTSATLQLLATQRYDGSYTPLLSWAFLRHDWQNLRLRLGRIGFDIYLNADSRHVNFAHLWVRPPVEFFGHQALDHFEGADLQWRRQHGAWQQRVKLYGGLADGTIPTLQTNTYYEISGSPLMGINWEISDFSKTFRIGYSSYKSKNDFSVTTPLRLGLQRLPLPQAGELAELLSLEDMRIHYYSIAAAVDIDSWRLQGSVSYANSESVIYPGYLSGFLLIGHQSGVLTPYLILSRIVTDNYSDKTDFLGAIPSQQAQQLKFGVERAIGFNANSQTTVALGVRYDWRPDVALKLQLDRVSSGSATTGLWRGSNNMPPQWDGLATIVSFNADMVF